MPTHSENAGAPLFHAYGKILLRHRWLALVASFCITALSAHQIATRLIIDNSTERFLSGDTTSMQALEDLRADFGEDTPFLLVVRGDVFSRDYLTRLGALHRELEALDLGLVTGEEDAEERPRSSAALLQGFEGFGDDLGWGEEATMFLEVTSLINARRTEGGEGSLRVRGWFDPVPSQAQIDRDRARVLTDERLVGQLVGQAGRHSVLILRADEMSEATSERVYDLLAARAEAHSAPDFQVGVTGRPAVNAVFNRTMLADANRLFNYAVVLSCLVLAWVFRHPFGVFGPALVSIQAFVWTLGAMAVAGAPMTLVTSILPAFITAVGTGDSVHIQSVYREARRLGVPNEEALLHALATTGVPVLFTSFTTAVGLLSFQSSGLLAIQSLGQFGAFGVLAALLLSLVFLPAVLSFNHTSLLGAKADAERDDWLSGAMGWCDRASAPSTSGRTWARQTTLSLGILLAFGGALLASQVEVHHNPLGDLPPDSPIRNATLRLDEHVGGSANLSLLIEAHAGERLSQRETLLALEKLEAHILDYPVPAFVDNVTSVLDPLRESWRATHDDAPEFEVLPDTQRGVDDMLTLFRNAAPEQLSQLATVDLSTARMVVRVRWVDAIEYGPFAAYIDEGIERYVGGLARVRATGSVPAELAIVRSLLSDLLKSFAIAFVVITLLMVAVFRDLKLGLIAMVPNLLPVVMTLGFMGALNIPLNINTLLIASVVIGIAVDDTIHLLHQFQVRLEQTGDTDEAVRYALSHTGRAMVMTSVILIGTFFIYVTADMINVQQFGVLMSVSITFALSIDLVFAPALLRWAYPQRSRAPGTEARLASAITARD